MESRARFLGHSIHQSLVAFPVGLLATAVILDLIAIFGRYPTAVVAAYWMMACGIVGALVAAPFGLIDLLAIRKDTRAARIGRLHGGGNLIVLLLFIGSWLMRRDNDMQASGLALLLSFGGGALALVTAWLGGELVARLGVGVAEGANLDAPSSLDGVPADSTLRDEPPTVQVRR
ncbi:MAG: DUF2231 domain-containing protein [Burkholderiaceae bacterium]|nr:DUF2231 domain-containing protein [Burkholderiaceae bacterium]